LMPFYTRFEKCKPVPERVGDTAWKPFFISQS
jgi:hypothetical protein